MIFKFFFPVKALRGATCPLPPACYATGYIRGIAYNTNKDGFNIASDIFSATSFTELEREARAIERTNRRSPSKTPKISHVQACLPGDLPIIAATDYVRALPQLIAPYLEGRLVALGTDGFGRSDKRAVLRKFFEVDSKTVSKSTEW